MFIKNTNLFRVTYHIISVVLGCSILAMSPVSALEVGVLDVQDILNSPEINFAGRQKEIFNQYYPKIKAGQEKYTALKNEFDKNEALMDDATRKEKQAALVKLGQSITKIDEQFKSKIGKLEQSLERTLSDLCAQAAKSEKLDIIFDARLIHYAGTQSDITSKVKQMLKKKHVRNTLHS